MTTRSEMRRATSSTHGRTANSRWLYFIGVAVFLLVGVSVAVQLRTKDESPKQHAQRLSRTHRIRVEFGPPATFYTPPYGPKDAIAPGFEPETADPDLAGVALEGIEKALGMYPRGFVDKLIDAIFICGMLRMDGALAGGSAGPAWIVISAAGDLTREHIRVLAELTLHHELSSAVLRWDSTTMMRWNELATLDARYVTKVRDSLARGEQRDPDPSTGFLTAYGSSNPENDFNTYAEKVFDDVTTVVSLARKYGPVKRKLRFVLNTYELVDERMLDYFRRSGLDAASR